jgi:phosphoglycolate phosphatase-like HAD superfamily hydrolase
MASKDSNEEGVNKPDNSEDNFGLPDLDYKPLDQNSGNAPVKEVSASNASTTDSIPPKPSVIAVASYLIWNFVYKPKQEAERVRLEQQTKAEELKKKQEEEASLAKQREEEERRRQEALAKAKPAVGTIETLTARTKRYYVIVTSDIDDDLLMDFAKKLSAKGISTKIIPPAAEAEKKFYRLAIADHDTYKLAQANANSVKADYGDKVWVIKY